MEDEMKKFREEHKRQTDKLLGEYASVRETMGECGKGSSGRLEADHSVMLCAEMYMDTMSMRLGLQNV